MSAPTISDRDHERERIRDLLGENSLFGHLSAAERWALSEHVHFQTFAKDDVLFNAGDPADSLYVIVDGRISPTDFVFTFITEAGDVIGEVWLFAQADGRDHNRHSGAKADIETTVLHIPYAALERFSDNAAFLLALVQRHQRYTHWSLRERLMRGSTGHVVAEVST